MSLLGERDMTRSAAAAFINEHEQRGIELQSANEIIDQYRRTIEVQAERIDALNKQIVTLTRNERTSLQFAVELATQVRTNVASNVRALEVAEKVSQELQRRIDGETTVAEIVKAGEAIEAALASIVKRDAPLDMPAETDGTTAATRLMLTPAPMYVDETGRLVGVVANI